MAIERGAKWSACATSTRQRSGATSGPATTSRLLTAVDGAELRRLEPHVYHLILTAPARLGVATALDRAVEEDARYAMLVEPLVGLSGLAAVPLRRACHVSIVSRSSLLGGVTRAATKMSQIAGGPPIFCYESLEVAYAAAQRALAMRSTQ